MVNVWVAIAGFLLGMLLMGAIVWIAMPKLMLVRRRSARSYDDAVAGLRAALQQKQDWMELLFNDYQQRTAAFGALERVCSVNVCNARYAAQILANDADRGVTAIMPPAIGVYEDKQGQVWVSLLNVKLLGMMFGGVIARVMGLAGADLNAMVDSVAG